MKNIQGDIFISIACYRDPEVIPTVKDAYNKAKFKSNIIFGVYAQMSPEDDKLDFSFINENQVRLLVKSHTKARGPSYARYIIYNHLYKNELYYLQIDSHTRFIQNWDEELVDMLSSLKANSVISTYPRGYNLNSDKLQSSENMNVLKLKKIKDGVPILTSISEKLDAPKRNLFWAAGYSFCYGAIFKFVQFDPHLKNLFWGEEFLMSLRFFTHNIKIYTPHKHIVYTLWSRTYRHTFWELKSILGSKFQIYGFLSFLRLCEIGKFHDTGIFKDKVSNEIEKYGIGKKKTLEEYLEKSGIKALKDKEDYDKIISSIYFSLKKDL